MGWWWYSPRPFSYMAVCNGMFSKHSFFKKQKTIHMDELFTPALRTVTDEEYFVPITHLAMSVTFGIYGQGSVSPPPPHSTSYFLMLKKRIGALPRSPPAPFHKVSPM